ncbi:MAG TPA: hypothetical protein VEA92_02440 [Candidatus Paceibacterota bacterium]|nr:hypothetical protein [Candidatus Paceibacterota bacterium]
MNIEDLSKSQLLLLMVLVNFVVSIATGVLTVSLLDQAPPTVTRTINQIVERTVETVSAEGPIPIVTIPSQPAAPTQEERLTNAIQGAAARTVTIHTGATSTPAVAVGVYFAKSRIVATTMRPELPQEAVIQFADGSVAQASLSRTSDDVGVYGFADDAALPQVASAARLATSDLRAGQTVIAITADRAAATGIISKVDASGIYTTLPVVPAGAAAVNLEGDVVGLSTGTTGVYVGAELISTLLDAPAT